MNTATSVRVPIVTPYIEGGRLRYAPTMREVFERLGFDFNGGKGQGAWKPQVWRTGWKTESDVLTRAERRALGFKP